jgi:hypothetical protein
MIGLCTDDLPGLMFLVQRWGKNSPVALKTSRKQDMTQSTRSLVQHPKILTINGVLKGCEFLFLFFLIFINHYFNVLVISQGYSTRNIIAIT